MQRSIVPNGDNTLTMVCVAIGAILRVVGRGFIDSTGVDVK